MKSSFLISFDGFCVWLEAHPARLRFVLKQRLNENDMTTVIHRSLYFSVIAIRFSSSRPLIRLFEHLSEYFLHGWSIDSSIQPPSTLRSNGKENKCHDEPRRTFSDLFSIFLRQGQFFLFFDFNDRWRWRRWNDHRFFFICRVQTFILFDTVQSSFAFLSTGNRIGLSFRCCCCCGGGDQCWCWCWCRIFRWTRFLRLRSTSC